MKRISLLLIVIAVMAFGSVNASACVVCGINHEYPYCSICLSRLEGADYCQFDPSDCGFCDEIGICPSASAQASLATQYTVASVERLDEQRTITASPMRSAQLVPKPTNSR